MHCTSLRVHTCTYCLLSTAIGHVTVTMTTEISTDWHDLARWLLYSCTQDWVAIIRRWLPIDSFHEVCFMRARPGVCVWCSCKVQANKYCKRRSCFSEGERSAVQLPLDCAFTLWKPFGNLKLVYYRNTKKLISCFWSNKSLKKMTRKPGLFFFFFLKPKWKKMVSQM